MTHNNIQHIEQALGITLPGAYAAYLLALQQEGGLVTDLVHLYGMNHLIQRNNDYQVQHYLPQYISIGDDSGGQAICLHCNGTDNTVYITGYGALDTGSMEVLSTGFDTWVQEGFPLGIIRESPDVITFHASETYQLRTAYYSMMRALQQLDADKSNGVDLKTYILQKRVLQQQIKDFEILHAGKKYQL
ncbi:SMI1/KNR4 family protein SUKH-1 [Chitinophaga niastensis]|uniref:SMI1/KNR4 family protein SUKH-1 n=1 Tax=Chitinophaga niastensis TaxID=536980 RepID=A0A2P8HNL1_CHINA|nr:SMI1/KNR4 family protein [Chitinophaga niastensis]PSL47806.1 SMI1/KNR4 family protein SUKH-1 [Chitinophaga niastensis]